MLVSFTIGNYRSFLNDAYFSMEKSAISELQGLNTFKVGKWELLKSACIYGKNAGGKSNLFKGIRKMRDIILHSFDDNYQLDIDKFRFLEEAERQPARFEIEFIKIYNSAPYKFRYGFEVNGRKIQKEWLYITLKRETPVFTREGPAKESITINGKYRKNLGKFKEFTKDDVLFITVINKLGTEELVKNIFDYIRALNIVDASDMFTERSAEKLKRNEKFYSRALKYLKEADQGIEEVSINFEEYDNFSEYIKSFNRKDLFAPIVIGKNKGKIVKFNIKSLHKKYDKYKKDYLPIEVDFKDYESEGTKKFFSILAPIVDALINGKVIFLDEIDSKLHPMLVEMIINKFNSIDENPKNAQLICNTHNPLILDSKKIRRDQFWFVDKNEFGESDLYRLTDFKGIRKDLKLTKAYLLGQFDAIPKIKS